MNSKPAPKSDDPEQSRRFIEMAQEREAEGTAETLALAVKKLASTSREPKAAPKKERRPRK